MLDLDLRYLTMVREILAKYVPGHTVWAFGSRVQGTAHAGSDLDLVIIDSPETRQPELLHTLRTAFRESDLPVLVDIMLWSDIPEAFRENITAMHAVLHPVSGSL